MRPFQEFAARETSGGIVLLACTLTALVWANSPWAPQYAALWHIPLNIGIGRFQFGEELHFWVNDALMTVFFFVVGLEIKRELLAGELASARRAALPIVAAAGGVVFPAILYSVWNAGGPGASGWGIPMATDIAFAIGVMALLGRRIPFGLKVFLTALAIVDDIAAVLVIALFYTSGISWTALALAAVGLLILFGANRLGVRHPLPYAVLGILVWMAVLASGVHATIAGVLVAFIIPRRTAINPREFLLESRAILDHFERLGASGNSVLNDEHQQTAIEALESYCEKMQAPLQRFEHALLPWVTFLFMPIFALANAGVPLSGNLARAVGEPIALGVALGLVFGKVTGVTLASWLAVRLGWASLPAQVSWRQIHGAGWLAGIGFTMSLFMASLAFADEAQLTSAKLGILLGSVCAGTVGSAILWRKA